MQKTLYFLLLGNTFQGATLPYSIFSDNVCTVRVRLPYVAVYVELIL